MKIIVIFIIVILLILSPRFRCIFTHPISTLYYILKDTYKYLRFKRWREYKKYGTLCIFTGLFGRGKTLMLTKSARRIYKKYNNKKVFDFKDNKWKTQHIYVVSNVHIEDIPYIELKNLSDMMMYADEKYCDNVSCWLFLVDEMSTQVNSREYKSNFSTELLNVLLTCRHYRFQILGSAQRFNHVDALVRQVTQNANECDKIWRLCNVYIYNAWTIENTSDITKIKPLRRKCFFIYDKDYNSYDTVATVNNFKDNVKNGNILTDEEIMQYQSNCEDVTTPLHLKRRFRKKIYK